MSRISLEDKYRCTENKIYIKKKNTKKYIKMFKIYLLLLGKACYVNMMTIMAHQFLFFPVVVSKLYVDK